MSLYHLSFPFPNMNPRELVDHIRSGPAVLVLEEPLRFRRRTRSNPCDFNEFLEALRSSETIRTVRCRSQHILGIREDEWVLLVKALGRIRDIQNLRFDLAPGSRDFHPFQAVADAINSAHSLQTLTASPDDESFLRDSSGLTALANAIRKQTGLQFTLIDRRPPLEAVQSAALDPVLQTLSACLRLQPVFIMTKFVSANAIRNLLQLPTGTELCLILSPDYWLAVANEIRVGRCLIKNLDIDMFSSSSSEATEAVKAVASAIREDRHLESLELRMEDGFTDEAGVALAEALAINKTLRNLRLDDSVYASDYGRTTASLGAQAYEAFGAMLRVNTSIKLDLLTFDADVGNEKQIEQFKQMLIE
jgi:hypothetical protein